MRLKSNEVRCRTVEHSPSPDNKTLMSATGGSRSPQYLMSERSKITCRKARQFQACFMFRTLSIDRAHLSFAFFIGRRALPSNLSGVLLSCCAHLAGRKLMTMPLNQRTDSTLMHTATNVVSASLKREGGQARFLHNLPGVTFLPSQPALPLPCLHPVVWRRRVPSITLVGVPCALPRSDRRRDPAEHGCTVPLSSAGADPQGVCPGRFEV